MIGEIIGKYKVSQAIGAGGMATVFLASHCDVPSLKVVLKKLTDPLLVDRFKREADKLAVLDGHSGICQIKHFFEFEGDFFIVMEYIDGPTLDELIKADDPPDMNRVLQLVRSILATLDYAHRQGIVHRDIKPTNIMMDRIGQVKIIDFGVAKGATDPDLTQVGTSLGSPRYMAPEQFNPQGAVDWVRCDLYAVGMTLYYMLTHTLPFQGGNIYEVCDAKRTQDAPAPSLVNPSIPAALDAVVMKAMAREPESRYASAAEMDAELHGLGAASAGLPDASQEDRTMVMGDGRGNAANLTMSIRPGAAPVQVPAPESHPEATAVSSATSSPALAASGGPSGSPQQAMAPQSRRPLWVAIGVAVVAAVVFGGLMISRTGDDQSAPEIVLAAPVLIEPGSGSSLAAKPDFFTWQVAGDSLAAFTWQCSLDPHFSELIAEEEQVGGRLSLDRELGDGVYFWRVRTGAKAARDTMWSVVSSFSVKKPQESVTQRETTTQNDTSQNPPTTRPNPPRDEQPKPVLTGSALIGARMNGVAVIADGALIVDGERRSFHFPETLVLPAGEHTIVAIYVYNGKEVKSTRKISIASNERQTLILDFDATD